MIIERHDLNDLEHKTTDVPRSRRRQDGYGSKIPTFWMVKLPGKPRWRRVYCYQWSNAGTYYVLANKGIDWVVIR